MRVDYFPNVLPILNYQHGNLIYYHLYDLLTANFDIGKY
jgi:hypothetical protein